MRSEKYLKLGNECEDELINMTQAWDKEKKSMHTTFVLSEMYAWHE